MSKRMATKAVHCDVLKALKDLAAVKDDQQTDFNDEEEEIVVCPREVINIIRKELMKVKRLAKARRAAGLEALSRRIPNLIDEKWTRSGQSVRNGTIIVDRTIELNNGNETLNSTLTTQTIKRSARLEQQSMSIIRTRHQKDSEILSTVIKKQKRSIEDEVEIVQSTSKRAKLKPETEIDTVFKKPRPLRGRGKAKNPEDTIDLDDRTITDEEAFFSSNVLHSSPIPATRTVFDSPVLPPTVVKVKTPSVKETVAAFERMGSGSKPASSTPRKSLLNKLTNNKSIDANKISRKSLEKQKEASKKLEAISSDQDSQEEDVIKDSGDESSSKTDNSNDVFGIKPKTKRRSSRKSENKQDEKSPPNDLNITKNLPKIPTPELKEHELNVTKNLPSKIPTPEQKADNLTIAKNLPSKIPTPEQKEDNLKTANNLRSKIPTPEGKSEEKLPSPRRSLRSKGPTPEGKIQNLNVTQTLQKLPTPDKSDELNSTHVIGPAASKRTKPVLKSKIFDAVGNNLMKNIDDCKVGLKPMGDEFAVPAPVPELKPPVLKRSSRLHSDSETENCKSDSELVKGRKRRSSELLEAEGKQKKKSTGERKSGTVSDSEVKTPRKSNAGKKVSAGKVKNEVVSLGGEKIAAETEPEAEAEPEPAPRPKRTRRVKEAGNEMETVLPKASKRTKPAKLRDEEVQEEPVRSTRTKTLKAAQMNAQQPPAINVINATRLSTDSEARRSDIENQSPVQPLRKRTKMNKKKEVDEENVIIPDGGGRITRTKSKAVKQNIEENAKRQSALTIAARKSIKNAKTLLQKAQLEKLIPTVCITPEKGFNNYISSATKAKLLTASKNQVLTNSTNKLQTMGTPMTGPFKFAAPLSSTTKGKIDNSSSGKSKTIFRPPHSAMKEGSVRKAKASSSSVESCVRSVTKIAKPDDTLEKELKLQSKKDKEEEARLKKEQAMKFRTEELRKKNEMKIKMANKQREKLELEKHNNIIQLEKEKEEKHKLILEERKMKLEKEATRKKMILNKKLNEVEERRKQEEEARLAKIKEQEAEQQRLLLEKQKEIERNEKREKERAAEKKARELFELKQKQEQAKEKAALAKKALAMASASKQQKRIILGGIKKEWNYKPRDENDYGLEDENSEVDSGDEEPDKPEKPLPVWAQRVKSLNYKVSRHAQLEMMTTFMTCYKKTPDIDRMFKMTPSKRIKRTSSAIWNTPSS